LSFFITCLLSFVFLLQQKVFMQAALDQLKLSPQLLSAKNCAAAGTAEEELKT